MDEDHRSENSKRMDSKGLNNIAMKQIRNRRAETAPRTVFKAHTVQNTKRKMSGRRRVDQSKVAKSKTPGEHFKPQSTIAQAYDVLHISPRGE